MRRKILFGIIACIGVFFIVMFLFANQDSHMPKEKIIEIFLNNKEKFVSVQEYANTIVESLYVDVLEMHDNDYEYHKDVIDLIKKYNIEAIYENRTKDWIYFIVESGTYEQGILYIKDNVLPKVSPSIGACERIIDHWFYYLETHI